MTSAAQLKVNTTERNLKKKVLHNRHSKKNTNLAHQMDLFPNSLDPSHAPMSLERVWKGQAKFGR